MSVGPFPIQAAIDRLRAEVPLLKLVGNSADLRTALAQKPAAVPCAFVLAAERGDPPKGFSGGMVQDVHVSLQVVLMVRNYAQQVSGAAARSDMDALITSVRTAVLGWAPSDVYRALNLQAARDESYDGGLLVCQEIYRTSYRIQVSA